MEDEKRQNGEANADKSAEKKKKKKKKNRTSDYTSLAKQQRQHSSSSLVPSVCRPARPSVRPFVLFGRT
jgi:hypothetical protein